MGFKVRRNYEVKPYQHQKKYDIEYDDSIEVNIDCDLISFKAASAAEKRFIIVTHKESNTSKQFKNKTEFYGHYAKKSGGWLAKTNKSRIDKGKEPYTLDDFIIEDGRKVDDISYIFNSVNKMIGKILDVCKSTNYKCWLGSGKNFRHEVATVQEYKGGRGDLIKPLYIEETRQYLKDRFNATEVSENSDLSNLEADDYLAIAAERGYQEYLSNKKCTTIQVSTDKDSYQSNGMFYNWDKMKKPFLVKGYGKMLLQTSETGGDKKVVGYGLVWLLHQMVTGDDADTYKPSKLSKKNVGEMVSYNLLVNTKDLYEGLLAVCEIYKEMYPEPVTYKHHSTGEEITKDWLGFANEYFTLAYMKRTISDDTTFTSLLEKYKIEY